MKQMECNKQNKSGALSFTIILGAFQDNIIVTQKEIWEQNNA